MCFHTIWIDAFTLPFTLQAYIQQLETSRIRLSQLEQQVHVARVQVQWVNGKGNGFIAFHINSSTSSVLEGPVMVFATQYYLYSSCICKCQLTSEC
jgi:hypothetical protein